MNDSTGAADRAFADLVSKAQADPSVLGLVLHGSRAFEGMATAHSDYDAFLIPAEGEQANRAVRAWAAEFDPDLAPAGTWQSRKSLRIDLDIMPLSRLRSRDAHEADDRGLFDESRYICEHAHVLIDRLDGQITTMVGRVAAFTPRHLEMLSETLDGYINLLYRSLKNRRDGHVLEAHLDAAHSMNVALWVIFAMHRRLKPPNKYLTWELRRRPLDGDRWEMPRLLPRIQRILADGDPDTQRSLFLDIESAARADGLSETVNGWGTKLEFLRGVRPA